MSNASRIVIGRLAHSQEVAMKSADLGDVEYCEIMEGIMKAIDYIHFLENPIIENPEIEKVLKDLKCGNRMVEL